jgi:thioesterase domain-containing protein/acyl carrier protein
VVEPRTRTEERVRELWTRSLKVAEASVHDDFFACGGNSLIAVALVNRINREFGCSLPLQVLFESPTIADLALALDDEDGDPRSRLVRLQRSGAGRPVFCWPGLGGYTMNLRPLAGQLDLDRPFYGIQAYGINDGEAPYPTIREMAAEDVKLIRQAQPEGPYTLWGYSFGARVAFESAYQLERAGERVEQLFLIAPGSPELDGRVASGADAPAGYGNPAYLTILFSVFAGRIDGPALDDCLRQVRDEDGFVSFVRKRIRDLDAGLVRRICAVVRETYSFRYSFRELAERRISAPVTIFKAVGDDYSFVENSSGYSAKAPVVVKLQADHYSMLKSPDVGELAESIRRRLWAEELRAADPFEPAVVAASNEGE